MSRYSGYHALGVDFCQADILDSTVTYLHCPECGSDNCGCEIGPGRHTHICFECEHETTWAL